MELPLILIYDERKLIKLNINNKLVSFCLTISKMAGIETPNNDEHPEKKIVLVNFPVNTACLTKSLICVSLFF